MKALLERMHWLNQPEWGWSEGRLWVQTQPSTDCWLRPAEGVRSDNAHALVVEAPPEFRLRGRFLFQGNAQYDQCGLYVRADGECWFKCSVEYETPEYGFLGSVVTNGVSDWATQVMPASVRDVWYEVWVKDLALVARYSLDGKSWTQIRSARLAARGALVAGVYGCSPKGPGFRFELAELTLE
jgi:regulation of enolase protein 1 (concanavalin A-like superfamily)